MRILENALGDKGGVSRDLATGAFVALITLGVGKSLKYLMHLLLARWMGAEQYGSFSAVLALTQVLSILGVLGLSTSALRFVPQYLADEAWGKLRGFVSRSREFVLLASILLAFAVLVGSMVLGWGSDLIGPVQVGVWLIPLLALMELHTEILRAAGRIGLAYGPGSVLYPAGVILATGLYQAGVGGLTANLALVLTELALLVVGMVHVAGWNISLGSSLRLAKGALFENRAWILTSLPMLMVSTSGVVMAQTDIFLIGVLKGPVQAGVYSAASKTAALISFGLVGISAMAAPMISDAFAREQRAALEAVLQRATLWGAVLSGATGILLAVFSNQILSAFGGEFTQGRAVLLVLAVGQVVNALAGPVGLLMLLSGNQNAAGVVYSFSAVGNVVLNIALIPRWGMIGAALVSTLSVVLWNVALSILARRRLGVPPFLLLRTSA